jgi:hypothetical protein
MKRTLHQGGPETLNFYSTTAGAYLGWAYLPSIVTKPGQAARMPAGAPQLGLVHLSEPIIIASMDIDWIPLVAGEWRLAC